ncbi:hypothetical protein CGRA01v4_03468 [Colletotrichum graminicola]|nr:hypothetical protein CGRA01v4_03468 [Colletotrichum graminicola]
MQKERPEQRRDAARLGWLVSLSSSSPLDKDPLHQACSCAQFETGKQALKLGKRKSKTQWALMLLLLLAPARHFPRFLPTRETNTPGDQIGTYLAVFLPLLLGLCLSLSSRRKVVCACVPT